MVMPFDVKADDLNTGASGPKQSITLTRPADYKDLKREWGKAWRAVKALIESPEDTEQVFIILRALSGKSFWKAYKKFAESPVGQNVLHNRIDLMDTLKNTEMLSSLPKGTLGREYYEFITRENISPEGLVDASESENGSLGLTDEDMNRYAARSREMHDLWHVVSGYGRDGLGEASIVAMSYVYSKNLGFALIAVMAAHTFKDLAPNGGVRRSVLEGYFNGRKSEWLLGVDWEAMMPLPLEEVRSRLNIKTPVRYQKTVASMSDDDLYTEEVKEARDAHPAE
jgi:ubiquinone biosynthesis protein COQ4